MLWQNALDELDILDDLMADFWVSWGPVIKKNCRMCVYLWRALILIVSGLLTDFISLLHGLDYILNRLANAMEYLLDLLQ